MSAWVSVWARAPVRPFFPVACLPVCLFFGLSFSRSHTAHTFFSHKRFVMALVQACRVSSLSDATSAVMSNTETAPHLVISISRPGSDARLRSVFAHPWRRGGAM